jgi:hypothetical protein
VRQLSRKRHWTFLVLERQKAKVGSIARRNPGSQKMVQDLWVWEHQVDAVDAFLEKRVVAEAMRVSGMATSAEKDASDEKQELALRLVAVDSEDVATNTLGEAKTPAEANTTMYDLTTLISPETLGSVTNHAAQDVTEGVWKMRDSHAWRVQLAIEKLKSYKESNEIQKQLPMVQNPAGSREARIQRLSKLGARSEETNKES